MATIIPSRFALKSIHEEIDLFDRKLAHAEKYGAFVSDKEREAAVNKLLTKRQQLVPSELPRSLRPVPEEAQP
jgi:hypothetical protein